MNELMSCAASAGSVTTDKRRARIRREHDAPISLSDAYLVPAPSQTRPAKMPRTIRIQTPISNPIPAMKNDGGGVQASVSVATPDTHVLPLQRQLLPHGHRSSHEGNDEASNITDTKALSGQNHGKSEEDGNGGNGRGLAPSLSTHVVPLQHELPAHKAEDEHIESDDGNRRSGRGDGLLEAVGIAVPLQHQLPTHDKHKEIAEEEKSLKSETGTQYAQGSVGGQSINCLAEGTTLLTLKHRESHYSIVLEL